MSESIQQFGRDLYGERARYAEIVPLVRETAESDREREPARKLKLKHGLCAKEMHAEMRKAARLADAGHRALAFYLAEMQAGGLHKLLGFSRIELYAKRRLHLGRSLCMELLRAGRDLQELKLIDRAFMQGQLSWTQVSLLVKVATTDNESQWLELALSLSARRLEQEVSGLEKGKSPRTRNSGLPQPTVTYSAKLSAIDHHKLELARRKLADMTGVEMSQAEVLVAMAELVLTMRPDGTLPDWTPVDHSLYTVVINSGGVVNSSDASTSASTSTTDPVVVTNRGPVPVDSATLRDLVQGVDILDLAEIDNMDVKPDEPTPARLRRMIIARDGGCCRVCGSRKNLMAHHIIWRRLGGLTIARNLTTVCGSCHALIHAGLIVVEGQEPGARFTDQSGQPLHGASPNPTGDECTSVTLEFAKESGRPDSREVQGADLTGSAAAKKSGRPDSSVALQTLPPQVDTAFFRQVQHCISSDLRRGILIFTEGESHPAPMPPPAATSAPSSPFRPTTFDQVVGQSRVVESMRQAARAAALRGDASPHVLLTGAPGLGKTTLAQALAAERGAACHVISAPQVESVHALIAILTTLSAGDVLFIDEVHALPRRVAEALYEAMEDGRITMMIASARDACDARAITLRLPAITFVAATSAPDLMPEALISRFVLHAHLDPYSERELTAIAERAAIASGMSITADAAAAIALSSRGAPRQVVARVLCARDAAQLAGLQQIDIAAAQRALALLGIDRHGLEPIERRALDILRHAQRPIAVAHLARLVGVALQVWTQFHEPYLLMHGHLAITPRGRIAVAAR